MGKTKAKDDQKSINKIGKGTVAQTLKAKVRKANEKNNNSTVKIKLTPKKGSTLKSITKPTATAPVKKEMSRAKIANMVDEALVNLSGRKGTTLQAIKNYMTKNLAYNMMPQSITAIKKYIKTAFEAGHIVQADKSEKLNYSKRWKIAKKPTKKEVAKIVKATSNEEDEADEEEEDKVDE